MSVEKDRPDEPEDNPSPVGTGHIETDGVLAMREQVSVNVLETVPIPRERAQNAESFAITVTNIEAWPSQTIEFRFDYNRQMSRWLFEAEHVGYDRLLFDGKSVASLGRSYSEYPYMLARFVAPTAEPAPERVRPGNLGDPVKLALAPGPGGGGFLDAAGVSRAEEDALLGRYASDYPVARDWV